MVQVHLPRRIDQLTSGAIFLCHHSPGNGPSMEGDRFDSTSMRSRTFLRVAQEKSACFGNTRSQVRFLPRRPHASVAQRESIGASQTVSTSRPATGRRLMVIDLHSKVVGSNPTRCMHPCDRELDGRAPGARAWPSIQTSSDRAGEQMVSGPVGCWFESNPVAFLM